MQAGEAACACPACGVVCRGRFGGCAAVWAQGPIALVRPAKQPTPAGPVAPLPFVEAPVPVPGPGAETTVVPMGNGNGSIRAALDEVLAELKALRVALEAQDPPPAPAASERSPAAERLLDAVDHLPDRIRGPVHDALSRLRDDRTERDPEQP